MTENKCNICPRKCNIDRNAKKGYCGETDAVRVARAALHQWEEPCISGTRGSGTVFFSGCNMKCVYCQNRVISEGKVGMQISANRLAEIFCELMNQGAHNINMVTPTHFTVQIIEAIKLSRSKDMNLPIVWNTSGYETTETIEMLKGYVDVYLTDFKYMDSATSKKYSFCPDYPQVAKEALSAMVRQTGKVELDENGIIKKGVVVRHLLLPGHVEESMRVLEYLHSEYGDDVYISIMSQFTPNGHLEKYPEIDRKVTKYEYDKLVNYADDIGIVNAYVQDGSAAKESFIPDFDYTGLL
ncbi:MAG: radical SAM protein [Clostridiales bacterium]|nr:radical SAM protein [Clostridiales bacterium]